MRGTCYYVDIGLHHQSSCQMFTYKFSFLNIILLTDYMYSLYLMYYSSRQVSVV